jgi:hypothetical protein
MELAIATKSEKASSRSVQSADTRVRHRRHGLQEGLGMAGERGDQEAEGDHHQCHQRWEKGNPAEFRRPLTRFDCKGRGAGPYMNQD